MRKKRKKEQRTSVLYIQKVPASLKFYFKAYCAKSGKSMTEVILDFMKKVTERSRQTDMDMEAER